MKNKFFTYVFAVILFGMSIINLCFPKQDFSVRENRSLQSFPKLNLDFMKNFDKYTTDHFFLRTGFVAAKGYCEFLLNKRENNGVYFCSDGYLIEKFEKDIENFNKNINYIEKFRETSEEPVYFYSIPAPAQILSSKLPPFVSVPEHNLSSIYDVLSAHSDEYIFYRTDHHWTTLGAFYAYEKIIFEMGFEPYSSDEFIVEIVNNFFLGTMSSKANVFTKYDEIEIYRLGNSFENTVIIGDYIYESLYFYERLNTNDKYSLFLDGNHARQIITSSCASERKLLLIKDSYAHAMVPFLANHFSEIHMLDLRYFNMSIAQYVAQNEFTDILILMSEKQLSSDSNLMKLIY